MRRPRLGENVLNRLTKSKVTGEHLSLVSLLILIQRHGLFNFTDHVTFHCPEARLQSARKKSRFLEAETPEIRTCLFAIAGCSDVMQVRSNVDSTKVFEITGIESKFITSWWKNRISRTQMNKAAARSRARAQTQATAHA